MSNENEDIKDYPEENTNLQLTNERLMALFQLSQRFNQIGDLQELLDEIIHSVITSLESERALLILTDESGESLHTVASETLDEEYISFSRSIVETTLERRETLLSIDLRKDSRFRDAKSVKSLNILSFVCSPLIVPGLDRALGALYVDQRIFRKIFTKEDGEFLESFANLAAISINNAMLMEKLRDENLELRQEVIKKYEFPGVIGKSLAMQRVFESVKQILNDNCTVLLAGESGTGKEVIARAIHYNSERKDKLFLAVNCGALPENLLEAELFGSVRGAFTGAVDKKGLFQAADGGTLFLDEIHHTNESIQVKLLRVLQNKEIRRVGGTTNHKMDVRLLCATNEDLRNLISEGKFRKDFYYRINVVNIDIPPLRERREDIPLLALHFLKQYSEERNKHIQGIEDAALKALSDYDWKGNNVRELKNEIERLVIFSKGREEIKLSDLSEKFQTNVAPETSHEILMNKSGKPKTYEEFEKEYVNYILSITDGNKAEAARIMGIPRSTLRGKIRKLNIGQ